MSNSSFTDVSSGSSASPEFCFRKRNVAIVLLDNSSSIQQQQQALTSSGNATPPPPATTTTDPAMVSIELSFGFNPADGSDAKEQPAATPTTTSTTTNGDSDAASSQATVVVPAVQFKKTMQRPQDEPLQKTIERIRLNFEAKGGGRKKGAKVTREDLLANVPTFDVLDENGAPVDPSLPNSVAWSQAKQLVVGTKKDTPIPVFFNPPSTILSIKPPSSAALGVPIVPSSVQLMNQSPQPAEVEVGGTSSMIYEWRVRRDEEPLLLDETVDGMKKKTPPPEEGKKKNNKKGGGDDLPVIEPSDYPDSLYEVVSTAPVATLSTTKKDKLLGRTLYLRVRSVVNITTSFWVDVVCPRITLSSASADMPRWKHTPQRLWNDDDVKKKETSSSFSAPPFRMVSYNILHDTFCTSNYAKSVLYPFAQEKFLDMTHRKGRIIQELLRYNTDLIGLQECGKDIYNKYYKSVLASLNYDSVFTAKTGNVTEGVATCYDSRRYELLEHHWFPLSGKYFEKGAYDSRTNGGVFPNGPREVFEEKKKLKNYSSILPETPTMTTLLALIQQHPHLEEGLSKVTSVGTATVLVDRFASSGDEEKKKIVLVTNCHLFWHPNGCHIRSIQCFLHMFAVETLRADLEAKFPNATVATVCCGDYNCGRAFREEFAPGAPGTPTGGYELMRTSVCSATNRAWKKGLRFWWGGEEEAELANGNKDSKEDEVKDKEADGASNPATTVGAYTKYGPPTICLETDLVLPSARKTSSTSDHEEAGGQKKLAWSDNPSSYYYDTHIADHDIQWTNYSPGFKAVIDHIFISRDHLNCLKTVPLPTESEVSAETAIPSSVFPSDHLALVADLEWKQ